MSEVRYSKDHEWVKIDGDTATVGITHYAQEQLGDVVFVELPEVGKKVEQGKELATVESVKAASEVYAPISGEVVEVNSAFATPATNEEAQGKGWFAKLKIADKGQLAGLMDMPPTRKFVEGLH
jgi:glycine cleavage system H protein